MSAQTTDRHPVVVSVDPWAAVPRRGLSPRLAKRLVDVVGATAGLIVLAPVILVAAVAIRATSRGPVIFRQERVGRHEQPFTMYKLRTMAVGNDDSEHREYAIRLLTGSDAPHGGETGIYKLVDDPRVTWVGRILRRYSIDELPQLVNVLRGDMSLVGPRPALAFEVEYYTDRHRARAAVRPGCTGAWQVSGRNTMTTLEMLDLDVGYAAEWTLGGDLSILARTPATLIRGDGAC